MGGKKSVFSEFCKSLGVGISAVLIVAAVVGVVVRLKAMVDPAERPERSRGTQCGASSEERGSTC